MLYLILNGRDAYLRGEFDATTIDPIFGLFDLGLLRAYGVNGGRTQLIVDDWQMATVDGLHKPVSNLVSVAFEPGIMGASPGDVLGGTLTLDGAAAPEWTNIRVELAELDAYLAGRSVVSDEGARQDAQPAELPPPSALRRGKGPHDTRHTAATRVLRASNLRVVQNLLGHADVTTTTKYAHAMSEDIRAALNAASPVKSPVLEDAEDAKVLRERGNSE